jgi:SPP1 family predicted phage head-tail adaptor
MAKRFRPSAPFNVPMKILVPTHKIIQGVTKKVFSDPETSELFYGSFRTFGGVENIQDNVYTLIDTATIDTWYRPDIKADCRIYICETGQIYEVNGDPEDIEMRHQYLQIKVRKVGGKP